MWAISIGATTTPTDSPPSLVASGAPSPTSSTPTDASAAVVPADCDALYSDATKAALADAGRAAEEHLLRDGIWIATTRSEVDPPAYTADIVAHIFHNAG